MPRKSSFILTRGKAHNHVNCVVPKTLIHFCVILVISIYALINHCSMVQLYLSCYMQ